MISQITPVTFSKAIHVHSPLKTRFPILFSRTKTLLQGGSNVRTRVLRARPPRGSRTQDKVLDGQVWTGDPKYGVQGQELGYIMGGREEDPMSQSPRSFIGIRARWQVIQGVHTLQASKNRVQRWEPQPYQEDFLFQQGNFLFWEKVSRFGTVCVVHQTTCYHLQSGDLGFNCIS